MSSEWRCEIEQDGPRFRWVLWIDGRRMAKAAKWWGSNAEARADFDEFERGVEDAEVKGP